MRKLFTLLILLTAFVSSHAQKNETVSAEELNDYKKQSEMMVKYFEETLNFLGDNESTVSEKEIIINESYSKIFKNSEVQIEDDLDENRKTPINKDVQAYLKDIDFFFDKAIFTFEIRNVEHFTNDLGELYFKVSLMRKLDAIAVGGDTVSNSRERFIEINLDPYKKDLKIVSFYTTKLNEKEELRNWWNLMSQEWRDYFSEDFKIYDTLSLSKIQFVLSDAFVTDVLHTVIRSDSFMIVGTDTLSMLHKDKLFGHLPDTVIFINDTTQHYQPDTIKTDISPIYSKLRQLVQTKEVNISYKQQFTDLEPISQLTDLQIIDCSNTNISDLSPLRNLNKLDAIYFSGSKITDISSLKYSVGIEEIYCFDTQIDDISILKNFNNLKKLYCFNTLISDLSALQNKEHLTAILIGKTAIADLSPLENLKSLRQLDISETNISDLTPIKNLTSLQSLNIDKTKINSLNALESLSDLNVIQFSYTNIKSLSSLEKLTNLKKVYCDNTQINADIANDFMRQRPDVLVIFETETLKNWWNDLAIYWKAIFAEQANTAADPSSEDLHKIINIKSLDLSKKSYLQNLDAISRFSNLENLNISQTEITNLTPLSGLIALKEINLSNTRIVDLSPLKNHVGLQNINIENTRVQTLETLSNMPDLTLIMADGSRITSEEVITLRKKQPQTLVVYQTESLKIWWGNLSQEWRNIFSKYVNYDINPTARQMQQIIDLEEIKIDNTSSIQTIEPLSRFTFLKKLSIIGNAIRDLSPIKDKLMLTELEIAGNPVTDLKAIENLVNIEVLNIESTPISDLSPIQNLMNIRVLNAGGTQIKSLKPLENHNKLEDVAIFNTSIKKLSPLDEISSLKYLKCYNTRIKSKDIDNLQKSRFNLNISYY